MIEKSAVTRDHSESRETRARAVSLLKSYTETVGNIPKVLCATVAGDTPGVVPYTAACTEAFHSFYYVFQFHCFLV